jgi:hypothetical protein
MKRTNFTVVPNEFINDLPNLNGTSIKLYLLLKSMANYERDNEYIAYPSWITIRRILKLGNDSITTAKEELISTGWIISIDTGKHGVNRYHLKGEQIKEPEEAKYESTNSLDDLVRERMRVLKLG